MNAIQFNKPIPYRNSKAGLIAGLLQVIGLNQVLDEKFTQAMGLHQAFHRMRSLKCS